MSEARTSHVHEVQHWPTVPNGYGVCACGATIRIENGKELGAWHTCPTCTPQFYGIERAPSGGTTEPWQDEHGIWHDLDLREARP